MKNKYLPYIIGILLTTALVILFITGNKRKKERQLNETITLKRQDKIPYGTYAAYENLAYLFPKATIRTNEYEPGYWDNLSQYDSNQALVNICLSFKPDEREMKHLVRFVEKGNDVFISTRYIGAVADDIFEFTSSAYDLSVVSGEKLDDNLKISLENPPFAAPFTYSYPGKTFNTFFSSIDTTTTEVLGYDGNRKPNFIHLRAGKGNFYIHTEPLAFSNYFVLHKENKGYYEKVLSVINPNVTSLVWDEYYLREKDEMTEPRKSKTNWFSTLMNLKNGNDQKPFIPAFLVLLLLLLLYVLLGMRRKQNYIPVLAKPRNDSLDFVKTIGRLYYDRGDHKNLCRKMAAYFLEHVRNKYKLPTGTLDENFIEQLRFKTGLDDSGIRSIVTFINYLDKESVITNRSLTDFHRQLESFYKKA